MNTNNATVLNYEPRTLFLGGIKPALTKSDLKKHFIIYGEIDSIILYENSKNPKLSKGYAFLKYKENSSAIKAQSEPQYVGGRQVECRFSTKNSDNLAVKKEIAQFRLFVRCLAQKDTAEDLREFFGQFAPLNHTYVIMEHRNISISKCYGFVHFTDIKSAKFVLKCLKKMPHPTWTVTQYKAETAAVTKKPPKQKSNT